MKKGFTFSGQGFGAWEVLGGSRRGMARIIRGILVVSVCIGRSRITYP